MIKKILNLFIYIGSYYSIIKKNYNLNQKVNFGSKKANNFFILSLKISQTYFELGSGNSTFLADKMKKKYLSIETDKSFFNYIKTKLKNIVYIDIGPTKYFSYPILPFFLIKNKIHNYSQCINLFIEKYRSIPDLILIDGRFRTYCVLSILENIINSNYIFKTKIIIDDYSLRENYKDLNTIIRIKTIERFGVIFVTNNTKLDFKKIKALKNKQISNFL
jgi:hypothetical protein